MKSPSVVFPIFQLYYTTKQKCLLAMAFLLGRQYHSRAQQGEATAVRAGAARLSVDIISHGNKIFVKFSFLTGILYPLCYNESTKGRGDRIDSIEKSRISICSAYLRSRNAMLGSITRRGGYRAKQGDPAVFGVCGNWITKMRRRKKAAYRSFFHAFGDCFKQVQRC